MRLMIDKKGTIITREDEIIISQKFYEICGRNFKITSSMALFNQGWMTVTRTGSINWIVSSSHSNWFDTIRVLQWSGHVLTAWNNSRVWNKEGKIGNFSEICDIVIQPRFGAQDEFTLAFVKWLRTVNDMIRVTFCFSLPGSGKCLEIYRGYF